MQILHLFLEVMELSLVLPVGGQVLKVDEDGYDPWASEDPEYPVGDQFCYPRRLRQEKDTDNHGKENRRPSSDSEVGHMWHDRILAGCTSRAKVRGLSVSVGGGPPGPRSVGACRPPRTSPNCVWGRLAEMGLATPHPVGHFARWCGAETDTPAMVYAGNTPDLEARFADPSSLQREIAGCWGYSPLDSITQFLFQGSLQRTSAICAWSGRAR